MKRTIVKSMTIDCGDVECGECEHLTFWGCMNDAFSDHGWVRAIIDGKRHQDCLDAEKAAKQLEGEG